MSLPEPYSALVNPVNFDVRKTADLARERSYPP